MPLEKRMETKMKNYETIEELLKSFKDGEIFLARSIYNKYFSDIYSEANYFKKLERLSKTQKISPITRGIYYVGSRIPKEEDIVSFFTHDQRGIEIGFGLYQKLKLTNLEPSIRVILSSAIEKNDRNIGNIRVISCNLDYTEDICNAITLLEVLKDFESISDISQKGFLEFCKEYSIRFNEKSIDIVLSKLKYKKNTISFLKDIFNLSDKEYNIFLLLTLKETNELFEKLFDCYGRFEMLSVIDKLLKISIEERTKLLDEMRFKSLIEGRRHDIEINDYDLDEEVNIGDKVVVLGYNGNETSVEVVKLKVMRIEELPMPINGYKYILRKKEDVAPTPPTPPVEEAPKPTCGTPFINRTYTVHEEVETIPVVQIELPKPQAAQEPWYRSIGEIAIYIASLVLLWRLIG